MVGYAIRLQKLLDEIILCRWRCVEVDFLRQNYLDSYAFGMEYFLERKLLHNVKVNFMDGEENRDENFSFRFNSISTFDQIFLKQMRILCK